MASQASAFISVMEGLPTTKDAIFVATTTPQLILNATSYNGTVPTVSLFTASNVVVGSNGCVVYATGSVTCLGVNLSTAGTGPFVMRGGDTMTGALFGSGIDTGAVVASSLYGNGNGSKSIGVDSSSVPVLNSSGFVPNFDLDSSSVNKKIGISSSCATGSYWDATTLSNGVLMGGSCVTLPSSPAIDVVSSITVTGACSYVTPSPAPRQLYIQECAGGGGGGQGNSTGSNGNKGNATWFDGVVVSSGFGGLTYTGNYLQGGRGGYGGTNGGNITNVIRHPGQPGGAGAALLDNAAIGGNSWFGGGGEVNGNNQVGVAAQPNSAGGGSGGEGSGVSGSGGGGGECAEFLINTPSGTYSSCFVGDGGTDGGGAQPAGGKGGSGIIVIWARY